MSSLLDAFHKALDAEIWDWTTRLVMADYLEEQGDAQTAEAVRRQCQEGWRPYFCSATKTWDWWTLARGYTNDPDDLPDDLYQLLDGHSKGFDTGFWRGYPTRRTAEEALWRAITQWPGKGKKARRPPEGRRGESQ